MNGMRENFASCITKRVESLLHNLNSHVMDTGQAQEMRKSMHIVTCDVVETGHDDRSHEAMLDQIENHIPKWAEPFTGMNILGHDVDLAGDFHRKPAETLKIGTILSSLWRERGIGDDFAIGITGN